MDVYRCHASHASISRGYLVKRPLTLHVSYSWRVISTFIFRTIAASNTSVRDVEALDEPMFLERHDAVVRTSWCIDASAIMQATKMSLIKLNGENTDVFHSCRSKVQTNHAPPLPLHPLAKT
jgi:hypothetical protein